MSVCLLLIDDGREGHLQRCKESLAERVGSFDATVEVVDAAHSLGFAGAIQLGWERVLETGCEWVFHVESDFSFNRQVPLTKMIRTLERQPHLAQMSLKRQPVNEAEVAAGGMVESRPDDYETWGDEWALWTEHRVCFTTNPSVYRSYICRMGWPQEPDSEGVFTHRLLEDPLLKFAIWGQKYAPPMVTHDGARSGVGY